MTHIAIALACIGIIIFQVLVNMSIIGHPYMIGLITALVGVAIYHGVLGLTKKL